jgi:hypothetical protein
MRTMVLQTVGLLMEVLVWALLFAATVVVVLWLPNRIVPADAFVPYSMGIILSSVSLTLVGVSPKGLDGIPKPMSRGARTFLTAALALHLLLIMAMAVKTGWVQVVPAVLTGSGAAMLLGLAGVSALDFVRQVARRLKDQRGTSGNPAAVAR